MVTSDPFGLSSVTLYRGTNLGLENQIFEDSGHIVPEAGRQAYMEAVHQEASPQDALAAANKASQQALQDHISVLGSKKAYIEAHGAKGTELKNKPGISWSTDPDVAKGFANGGPVYQTTVPSSQVFPQTLPGAGESEALTFHGTPATPYGP